MFVMNTANNKLVYRAKGEKIVLEPAAVTEVDENKVSEAQLKACFGTYIDIINVDRLARMAEEGLYTSREEEVVETIDTLFEGSEEKLNKELGVPVVENIDDETNETENPNLLTEEVSDGTSAEGEVEASTITEEVKIDEVKIDEVPAKVDALTEAPVTIEETTVEEVPVTTEETIVEEVPAATEAPKKETSTSKKEETSSKSSKRGNSKNGRKR